MSAPRAHLGADKMGKPGYELTMDDKARFGPYLGYLAPLRVCCTARRTTNSAICSWERCLASENTGREKHTVRREISVAAHASTVCKSPVHVSSSRTHASIDSQPTAN